MGWFDEQLNERKKRDRETFEEAFIGIAGAVVGKNLASALEDREIARSAIEAILRYYKLKANTDDIPKDIQTVDDELEYFMRPFGIMRREVDLSEGWYKCASGAMLGTLSEDGSAVALIPDSFSGYSFIDFRTGKKVKLNKKTEKLLDRQATCFYRPFPLRSLGFRDLLVYMKNQLTVSDIVIYIAAMAASALVGLMAPIFTKWLFGSVLESGSIRVLAALAVFMLSFSLCNAFVNIFKAFITSRIEIKQNVAVEAAVMARVMALPANFFKDYASGELLKLTEYVKLLCSTVLTTVVETGFTALFSLIYIGQIVSFAKPLVLPAILITLSTVAVSLISALMNIKVSREIMETNSKESGMSYSMITGIQKIKLAGAERRMFSRWAKLYSKSARLEYNPPMFLRVSTTVNLAVSLVGTLVLYFVSIKSGISIADYYAFNAAYAMVSTAFISLASIATTVAAIKPMCDMTRPILEAVPEITDGKKVVTSLRGSIELSNVSFRYSDDQPNIIDNLSLNIRPGEYVAIVGKTGCGKSTLIRLLLGFEKPQKGAIYYDKRDMAGLDLKSLRKNMGVVMQDGKLFLGDIYSNIVISAPELTVDDAWKAAEIASIADDIREMPMGMFTLIAEGQGGISGGQRQRLMIARAVAPGPKVLMFDEATSALDNVTQKKVTEAIDKLNCTRIVIAHRLSTIRHCDRIIVLDGGRIAEEGTYDELISTEGLFSELVRRQRLDLDDVD